MKDYSQNELLSAYLDGELTVEQRAKVEEMLATSPAARQLLDELRLLCKTLKSLPRHKLGVNLTESVLRDAEHRMLTESTDTDDLSNNIEPGVGSEADTSFSEPLRKRLIRRMKNPRVWVWEAVIVAVVLLLMVYNPNQDQNQKAQPIANHDQSIAMTTKDVAESISPAEPPSMQAARPIALADGLATSTSGIANKEANKDSLVVSEGINTSGKPAVKSELDSSDIAKKREAASRDLTGGMQNEIIDGVKTKDAEQSLGKLLVVHCAITPDAIKNQAFDKLLAENGIVWSNTFGETALYEQLTPVMGVAEQPSAVKNSISATDSKERHASGLRGTSKWLEREPVEMVYVEASPDQIQATLKGISTQTKTFLSVAATPARDNWARLQFDWNDNLQMKISDSAQVGQKQVEEKLAGQTPATVSEKERMTLGSTNVARADRGYAVQGRAQRVPLTYYSDIDQYTQQTLDREKLGSEIAKTTSPQMNSDGRFSAGRALGPAPGGGMGGGYAHSNGIAADEEDKNLFQNLPRKRQSTTPASPPASLPTNHQSGGRGGRGSGGFSSPARSVMEAVPAKDELQKIAKPAASPAASLAKKPGASEITQEEKSNQLFLKQDLGGVFYGSTQNGQSDSPDSQRMQRVLFVFQLVDEKDAAERAAGKATPADAAPASVKPSEPVPAKE
jgi:hypothetical protein